MLFPLSAVILPLTAQTGSVVAGFGGPTRSQPNNPVSIVIEHKTVQTLPDGTHLTSVTHESFSRDSQGRTRVDMQLGGLPQGPGVPQPHSITVTDPTAGTMTMWITGDNSPQKTYTRHAMPNAARSAPAVQPAFPRAQSIPPGNAPNLWPKPEMKRISLGQQAVQGEICEAMRVTIVYPEGMFGNDRPITATSETCNSIDFGRSLQDRQEDPRTGIRTSTLQSVSHAEPDSSLFQPPVDYTEHM
jgi:hypothetical protein